MISGRLYREADCTVLRALNQLVLAAQTKALHYSLISAALLNEHAFL